MLNKKISIFFLIFLSIIFADKKFSVNSKTENKISILFELKDYSIDKINGEDRISGVSNLFFPIFFFKKILSIPDK